MTDEEIVREYRLAKNKLAQIEILADQNQVRKQVIVDILRNNGVEDLPSQYMKLPGAKSDKGKLVLKYVPPELITAVAKVREYGNQKYMTAENWRDVDPEKFHDAMLRHILAMWVDWKSVDPESGLPHLWHLMCNGAFLCAFLEGEEKDE
jgi:hypothetical protein